MLRFIPKDTTFFDLLDASAERALEAATSLEEASSAARIGTARLDALQVFRRQEGSPTRAIVDHLNRTFVTPIDREDIHALALKLDDIIDAVVTAGDRLHLYRLEARPSGVSDLMGLLREGCGQVRDGVRNLRVNALDDQLALCHRVHDLGNRADLAMHSALDALFNQPVSTPADVLAIIKVKEVYDYLKRAIDSCEGLADQLHAIAVKNA
jgi:uncharacterized protein Yka (UPF0111/DUF47 family)